MNECSILWCGKYRQNWENEPHCHNYFQMVGILSGSGRFYVEDHSCWLPSRCTPSTAAKKATPRCIFWT